MHHKKGSMELSVNSIVILVIAIVIMGLILGFIQSKFKDVSAGLIKEEPEAAAADISNPITMSRSTVITGPGKTVALKINLYNPSNVDITGGQPVFTCSQANVINTLPAANKIKFNQKMIGIGNMTSYEGVLVIGTVSKDTYLCQVCLVRSTAVNTAVPTNAGCTTTQAFQVLAQKDFTIEVQ